MPDLPSYRRWRYVMPGHQNLSLKRTFLVRALLFGLMSHTTEATVSVGRNVSHVVRQTLDICSLIYCLSMISSTSDTLAVCSTVQQYILLYRTLLFSPTIYASHPHHPGVHLPASAKPPSFRLAAQCSTSTHTFFNFSVTTSICALLKILK